MRAQRQPRRRRRLAPFVPAWSPRERPLLLLDDGGAARALAPSLFGIGGRDPSWNLHAENFLAANRPGLTALEVEPELVPRPDQIDLRLRPGGTLGAVPLHRPDTRRIAGGVVVRPRFGWSGIGPILQRVGWSASPRFLQLPLVPGSAREVPPWVLAGPVLQRLGSLLREIHRGFHLVEEVRTMPRGQILWGRYVSEQMARGAFHHLPCRFPELGPDALLRAYLRWGIQEVRRSLLPHAAADTIARRLAEAADELLASLRDTAARAPDRSTLDRLMLGSGLPSVVLHHGLEALGWIVDERGLAGQAETDGLAWALPMADLFERWVEHLVRHWAREIGAEVATARTGETTVAIHWPRGTASSLKSLVPDLVVRRGDAVTIVDAKYKGHFQELDETRWTELATKLREQHRHDVHQALAYAALYEAEQVTTVLAYPMRFATWARLAEHGRTVVTAEITGGGRSVRIALLGVPLEGSAVVSESRIAMGWSAATAVV